jgi:hypothetical protein
MYKVYKMYKMYKVTITGFSNFDLAIALLVNDLGCQDQKIKVFSNNRGGVGQCGNVHKNNRHLGTFPRCRVDTFDLFETELSVFANLLKPVRDHLI